MTGPGASAGGPPPVVWTIAGTDPGGGAGIQGDLTTLLDLGAHGASVITAVIAQNTQGVQRVDFVTPDLVTAQLQALADDLPPAAIKIGMLGTGAAARAVAAALEKTPAFTVYDPVGRASGGQSLSDPSLWEVVRGELLPRISLLTPNLPETEGLLGRPVRSEADVEEAARELVERGARAVLLKGGHRAGAWCQDYWTDGRTGWWLTSPRQASAHTHGTGCTLSSAIAGLRAQGMTELDAVVLAKAYVNQGIRLGGGIGKGRGPLRRGGWPAQPGDLPWVTPTAEAGRGRPEFPPAGPWGEVYPLADRAAWIARLLPLGVRTVQIRIKDLTGAAREREIRAAAEWCRQGGAHLFVNDDWRLAQRCGAYGVHLGQDDLADADPAELARSGLRLGISTHNEFEIARAAAWRPSYVALGTVFPSPSKSFRVAPLGVERFRRLRALVAGPVVAIGGLTVENAAPVIAAGAEAVAVISDLARAADLPARVAGWRRLFDAARP